MENINEKDLRYQEAQKRVKQLKKFYVFLFVYFAVNIFILLINYNQLKPGESIWHFKYFSLPVFWGIGMIGYAISVFLPAFIFGSDWEDRKIRQIMDKNK